MEKRFGKCIGANTLSTTKRTGLRPHTKDREIRGASCPVSKFVVFRGFTLVELLVSISIFTLITTAVVVNLRSGQRSDELRLGAKAVVNTLQALATFTQSGTGTSLCAVRSDPGAYTVCSASCTECEVRAPVGGYGIHIEEDGTITEFADTNRISNRVFDKGEALSSRLLELPRDITVAADVTDIVFAPPDGAVWIIDGRQEVPEARITLTHTKTDGVQVISVQRASGRISVE